MRLHQFSTESYPVQQRLHVWAEALDPLRLKPALMSGAPPLYATLSDGLTSRGVGLARIASSPQTAI